MPETLTELSVKSVFSLWLVPSVRDYHFYPLTVNFFEVLYNILKTGSIVNIKFYIYPLLTCPLYLEPVFIILILHKFVYTNAQKATADAPVFRNQENLSL